MSLTNSPYWFGGGVDSFYPTQINDSLRFEDGSSAYLNRTPSSASNRKTWTYSFWVKRANLNSYAGFLAVGTGDGSEDFFGFTTSDKLYFRYSSGSDFTSSQVFRDVSSWYHIVLVADTTQSQSSSTASDSRLRYYVNGTQITAFDSGTMPSQNFDFRINSAAQHYIGEFPRISSHLDGYLADINFIDGQALDPTSFGEEKDGTWIPSTYSGSYGTNGFHLEFDSNTNDTSGNGNNWTANNISAHDYVLDSPTNNFATLNVLSKDDASVVYSEGNLQAINSTATSRRTYSTIAAKAGKWYFEYYVNAGASSTTSAFGVQQATDNWADGLRAYRANGQYFNGSSWSSYGASFTTGDIISFAVDYDSDTIEFFKNNVSQGQKTSVGFDTSYDYVALINLVSGFKSTANFGQDSSFAGNHATANANADENGHGSFAYAPPSGFLALCSQNLPDVDIIDGSTAFSTVLYTGTSNSNSVTGVGFSPDFTWLKQRNSNQNHGLFDSVRGSNKFLISNSTAAENTRTTDTLSSFDSDGFTLTAYSSDAFINYTGRTMVAWNWKAGGTAVSNTSGSITSSVSANTDAGFSIVSYTGTGANATVGHGLGVEPSMIIVKVRSTTNNWATYVKDIGNTKALLLDTTNAGLTSSLFWNNTTPTSSVFSISTGNSVNNSGQTYIAYCFANSDTTKVGSYTGNGSSDGTFVYTGFRPAFVIIKRTDSANWWNIFDSAREPTNDGVDFNYLQAESSNAENNNGASIYPPLDFLSNGFKLRYNGATQNASGGTYIYLAFAETPFKYANAR